MANLKSRARRGRGGILEVKTKKKEEGEEEGKSLYCNNICIKLFLRENREKERQREQLDAAKQEFNHVLFFLLLLRRVPILFVFFRFVKKPFLVLILSILNIR